MNDLSVSDMLAMQEKLQERYKGQWEPIGPETARNKLLWMICEMGEVIDIIKKQGPQRIMTDSAVRSDFVEEMADVLMYYHDVLLCYGITPEELQQAYTKKFERNITRW